jgi:AcrR family transcriptional regulator
MEPRKRRRVPLTRARVLRRALRIADKQGLAALSMRKLAQELGVEAMSLYHHVENKDDIVDGLLEVVVSEIEVPKIGDDWREAMRRRARSAHDVLTAHPWATMLLMSRVSIGPAMMRYVDLGADAGDRWHRGHRHAARLGGATRLRRGLEHTQGTRRVRGRRAHARGQRIRGTSAPRSSSRP